MKNLRNILILFFVSSTIVFAQSQTGRDKGIEFYEQADYKNAIKVLKEAAKAEPADHTVHHYLGLSLMNENKLKDAEKAFERAIKLNPNFAGSQTGLAYIYLRRDKLKSAAETAEKAVALDGRNAEAYFVLSSVYLRSGNADRALENTEQAIKLDPNFASAHLLKAHSLMNLSLTNQDYKNRSVRYGTAGDSIGKFITLSKNLSNIGFWQKQRETLKFFADYYTEREKNRSAVAPSADDSSTPVKILNKKPAGYTEKARQASVSGFIRLLVAFSEDGTIKHVLALNSLGFGLDEEAIDAAKDIKFEPATKDGRPVTVVKTIEYTFSIY